MTKELALRTLEELANILENAAKSVRSKVNSVAREPRGIFRIKSTFGYDVRVDGCDLGLDVSFGKAEEIMKLIEEGRRKS